MERRKDHLRNEMKHTRTKTDTPTILLLLDEFILKRRPGRQRHRAEPSRIRTPIIHGRESDRFRRIPATERGDRPHEQNRLSERSSSDNVERDRDGGDGGGAGR